MATTYAAYNNIMASRKAAEASRRPSTNSTTSTFSVKGAVDQLRPTTETIRPTGIYTPIIKQGPLFSGSKPTEQAQEPTPISQRKRSLFSFGSGKKNATAAKHSPQQRAVDAALLR